MSAQDIRDAVANDLDLQAEIARLAALTPLEYDRARDDAAKTLGVRVGTLDKEVSRVRPQDEKVAKGRRITLYEPEPWPEPVDGAEVLDLAHRAITRHMVMRDEDAAAAALWAAHAHVFDVFSHTPRLIVTAPDAECGKTVLMFHLVGSLVTRPQNTENLSPAPFFRLAEEYRPCFLIDECDTFIQQDADILGAINNGWEPHGCVLRCVGDDNDVREFSTHAPVAMAGIDLGKKLPSTTLSRSIVISLHRATDDEIVQGDIFDARRHKVHIIEIGRKLARWTQDHAAELARHDPSMPTNVRNRLADKWRPLFAVAEVAGGNWPELTRRALLGQVDVSDPPKALQLLMDIYDVLGGQPISIHTHDLIDRLCMVEGSMWAEYNFRARDAESKRITTAQLHNLIGRYVQRRKGGVRAGPSGVTRKGLHGDDLRAAWSRYLPDAAEPPKKGLQGYKPVKTTTCDAERGYMPQSDVTPNSGKNSNEINDCNPVTPISPPPEGLGGCDDFGLSEA